ncbi:hypothetical protein CONCODRAFT_56094 [Conidiobolus coronatus NRRL 28638]|uniref:Mediator of RNA polymerase II transcription subunit 21 n=1 Tax=Conidiobolus coronatus (strain ATCC 28846 / CBS 209.66 / NRRL 28638) TaxID=796925 RepID=A0A137PCI6_CONC2|nr:hypothetical protein CONCODRAFT_56094 [Conidiobolus coronatus NRRL 28638]|eukprot:KXN72718.1 hypothetical protein CONCODRAFT_56094 [Conidiobolus coronatus NRRL 28638]
MDRITQLQDHIDGLSLLFVSCIDYLHNKTSMISDNPNVPVTKSNELAVQEEEFNNEKLNLAKLMCNHSKQIDELIDSLPGSNEETKVDFSVLENLSQKNIEANEEYLKQVDLAKELYELINSTLQVILKDQLESM